MFATTQHIGDICNWPHVYGFIFLIGKMIWNWKIIMFYAVLRVVCFPRLLKNKGTIGRIFIDWKKSAHWNAHKASNVILRLQYNDHNKKSRFIFTLNFVRRPKLSTSVQAGLAFSLEICLNIHKPVVLSHPFPTTRCARLQVTSSKTHHEVCNKVIRSFTRPMWHKNAPVETVSQICTIWRLAE